MRVSSRVLPLRLSLIDRYMFREFLLNLIAVTSVLWLIYVATRFARYLAQAAVGNLPAEVIFSLLWFSSLGALSILLPIATFLAVMLSLGRMSSDSELTVIAACGISGNRIMRNVTVFSGAMAIIIAWLALFVVPQMNNDRYAIEERARVAANTGGIVAGSFKESRDGQWTFYSQGVSDDKQSMENIFIEIHRSQRPLIFRAERGHFEVDRMTGDKYLVLENGYRYEGEAGDLDFVIAQYESHSMLIEKGQQTELRERQRTMSSLELWQRGHIRDLAELQWRFSSAIMTVILGLIAITLANAGPRQGRYAGFFPAVLIYIIYSNLLGISRAWISAGTLPPLFGTLWVHVLMLGVFAALYYRQRLRIYWHHMKNNAT